MHIEGGLFGIGIGIGSVAAASLACLLACCMQPSNAMQVLPHVSKNNHFEITSQRPAER